MKRNASNVDGFVVRPSVKKRPALDDPNKSLKVNVKKSVDDDLLMEREDFSDDLTSSLTDLPGYDDIKSNDLIEVEGQNVNDKNLKKALKKAKKHDKKSKIPKSKKRKRVLIILAVVLLLISGAFLAMKYLWPEDTIEGNWWEVMWSQDLKQDENGFSNILIFGTAPNDYDGPLLADTVMVLSINQTTKEIYMVSLPRDLWVKHECPNPVLGTTMGKLNETYRCALSDDDLESQEESKASGVFQSKAGEITGLDIQYYVHMQWEGIIDIVNALGGIDVVIESDDPRGIYDVATKIKYPNGTVHVDGEEALALARARGSAGGYGLEGSNYSREKHQQQIIKAIQEKALSSGTLSNPMTLVNMIQALGSNVYTNFTASELQTVANLGKETDTNKMISLPLIDADAGIYLVQNDNINGASVVVPVAGTYNYSEIKEYIKEAMSSDPIVKEKAVIDVLNGSGTVGLASEKAEVLTGKGYKVGEITNAPTGKYESVEIYQLNDKPATAKALKDMYSVDVKTTLPFVYSTTADFVIIFGS